MLGDYTPPKLGAISWHNSIKLGEKLNCLLDKQHDLSARLYINNNNNKYIDDKALNIDRFNYK